MLIDIRNIDINLIKKQKRLLVAVRDQHLSHDHSKGLIEGVLNLLDHIHDTIDPPEGIKPKPVQLYVAKYENKYGDDVRIFLTEQGARAWKDEIASESWEDYFDEDPPETNIGDTFFERLSDNIGNEEWFGIELVEVNQ